TGAFLLAEAGLLDGRRATTHWGSIEEFARRYPTVRLEPDTIYVREGSISTSAGVTAGMDLALAMVEEDCGRDVALAVARELVLFLRRPGGQAQFSAQPAVQLAEHEPLRDLQTHILDRPGDDLSVETPALRHGVRQAGVRQARHLSGLRLEAGRAEDRRGDAEGAAGEPEGRHPDLQRGRDHRLHRAMGGVRRRRIRRLHRGRDQGAGDH